MQHMLPPHQLPNQRNGRKWSDEKQEERQRNRRCNHNQHNRGNVQRRHPQREAERRRVATQSGGYPVPRPVLTCPTDKYVETMVELRRKIILAKVGVYGGVRTRRAATGAVIFEISGENSAEKADALAGRMQEVIVGGEGTKVDRPLKMAEVRVRGLEWSVTTSEVIDVIVEKTRCFRQDIRTGHIRRSLQGLGSLWLRLPLAAAKELCHENRLHVGWFSVAIEMLDARHLRCHKCLEKGYVRNVCPSSADRTGRCYRCGATGHAAKTCKSKICCPLCSDLKRSSGHVLGGPECAPQRRRGKLVGKGSSPPAEPVKPGPSNAAQIERKRKSGARDSPPPNSHRLTQIRARRRKSRGPNARYGP